MMLFEVLNTDMMVMCGANESIMLGSIRLGDDVWEARHSKLFANLLKNHGADVQLLYQISNFS